MIFQSTPNKEDSSMETGLDFTSPGLDFTSMLSTESSTTSSNKKIVETVKSMKLKMSSCMKQVSVIDCLQFGGNPMDAVNGMTVPLQGEHNHGAESGVKRAAISLAHLGSMWTVAAGWTLAAYSAAQFVPGFSYNPGLNP